MATPADTPFGIHPPAVEDRALAWTVWPARDRLGVAVAVFVVVCVVAGFATELMQSAWAGLFASLFLVHGLRQFFFPTVYHVDAAGITTRCLAHTTHHPWRRIRRFRHDFRGAFLSTRARPSVRDRFSGLHLTWNMNREQAVRLIEDFRSPNTGSPEPGSRETAACGTG